MVSGFERARHLPDAIHYYRITNELRALGTLGTPYVIGHIYIYTYVIGNQ